MSREGGDICPEYLKDAACEVSPRAKDTSEFSGGTVTLEEFEVECQSVARDGGRIVSGMRRY